MSSSIPSHLPMPPQGPCVIPAATVVIFRRAADGGAPELLMLERTSKMRFAGGAVVFPGGSVDPGDFELARSLRSDEPEEIAAARVAAIRETLEETGLLIATRSPVTALEAAEARRMLNEGASFAQVLDRFGCTLMPEQLTFYAHWCPPWEQGFDTRFFLYDLGTGAVDLAADATENARLFWTSAASALDMAARGEVSVIFPTLRNLERLAQFASFEEALADVAAHPVARIHPQIEQRADGDWIVIPEGHGYPVLGQPRATARRS